jgi:hypothetical protein
LDFDSGTWSVAALVEDDVACLSACGGDKYAKIEFRHSRLKIGVPIGFP